MAALKRGTNVNAPTHLGIQPEVYDFRSKRQKMEDATVTLYYQKVRVNKVPLKIGLRTSAIIVFIARL